MERQEVELESLIGLHKLSGLDFGRLPRENDWEDESATMSFVLDGKTYTAVEDPSDGYRSTLRSLFKGGSTVKNKFAPCRVMGLMRRSEWYGAGRPDVLSLHDVVTGKAVLEVGTDHSDGYYPSCVMFFDPAAMAVNAGKG